MKKLLIIAGSPRPEGNTKALCNRVKEDAPSTFDVEIISLTDVNLNGCLGCSSCQGDIDSHTCVQQDDANSILDKIVTADAVLYATPLYGHNYSGQMKVLLDRHVPLFKFVEGEDKAVDEMKIISFIEDKPVGLLVSCQGPVENNAELIQMLFDKFCESSLATCFGKYVFPFCDPSLEHSFYDEETLQSVWIDLQANV